MRSQRHGSPTTSPGRRAHCRPRSAPRWPGSPPTPPGRSRPPPPAAPAIAQAIAASPPPAAKSSTVRPRTSPGSSSTRRASACAPGQANAQNGGSMPDRSSQASVACQIGRDLGGEVQRDLRHQRGAAHRRVRRDERFRRHKRPSRIASATSNPASRFSLKRCRQPGRVIDVERGRPARPAARPAAAARRRTAPPTPPSQPDDRQQRQHGQA